VTSDSLRVATLWCGGYKRAVVTQLATDLGGEISVARDIKWYKSLYNTSKEKWAYTLKHVTVSMQ
jgi:hypothetical protein